MNCLVIDDNPKTLAALCEQLRSLPAVNLVVAAAQPYQGRTLLDSGNVDVLFIRVRLWHHALFDGVGQMPAVVFVTGGKERMTTATTTAVPWSVKQPHPAAALAELLQQVAQASTTESADYLFLHFNGRFHRVWFQDIEMIERKAGNYVLFHLRDETMLVVGYLSYWMQQLPADKFSRVADQLILPLSEVENIQAEQYTHRGRIIDLTFRFARAAKKEMEDMIEH